MTSPTTAEVLEAAADRIAKPGAWTQGTFARDTSGDRCAFNDPNASCFCAAGAIYRSASSFFIADPLIDRLGAWARKRGFRHLAAWNDAPGRTQAEVVEALRSAALQAAGGGQ